MVNHEDLVIAVRYLNEARDKLESEEGVIDLRLKRILKDRLDRAIRRLNTVILNS